MPAFHFILHDEASAEPGLVDFIAASPEQAFQIARNETDGVAVELWQADTLIARTTKAADNLWLLHGSGSGASRRAASHRWSAAHNPPVPAW